MTSAPPPPDVAPVAPDVDSLEIDTNAEAERLDLRLHYTGLAHFFAAFAPPAPRIIHAPEEPAQN